MNDGFTLEIVTRLYAGQKISTAELKEVLRLAGVDAVIIDYIANIHSHKVEGKTSTPMTIAKRSMQKHDAYAAVKAEIDKARRNSEKISATKAIERVDIRKPNRPDESFSASAIRRQLGDIYFKMLSQYAKKTVNDKPLSISFTLSRPTI